MKVKKRSVAGYGFRLARQQLVVALCDTYDLKIYNLDANLMQVDDTIDDLKKAGILASKTKPKKFRVVIEELE